MIRTIVACPAINAATAAKTAGRRRISRTDPVVGVEPAVRISWSWAIAKGSGRSITKDSIAAIETRTTGTRYGPASGGRPIADAKSSAIGASQGPRIPPIVVPQTTKPIATDRRWGETRSAAAYRERLFEELPKPIRKVPASRSGKERRTT